MDSDEEDFGDWEEDEQCDVQGLLSKQSYASVSDLLQSEKTKFNFDLPQIINDMGGLDEIGMIMLVNFIRKRVSNATVDASFVADLTSSILSTAFLSSEEYMKPVLDNDPLLFLLGETLLRFEEDRESPDMKSREDA